MTSFVEIEPDTALPPPSDERLKRYEAYARLKLPPDYVAMLRSTNGGVPVRKFFGAEGWSWFVARFLSLLDAPNEHGPLGRFDLDYTGCVLDHRLCDRQHERGLRVVPIAALYDGDYLCFDFRGDVHRPVVALWLNEESRTFQPCLRPVASSFTSFIDTLGELTA